MVRRVFASVALSVLLTVSACITIYSYDDSESNPTSMDGGRGGSCDASTVTTSTGPLLCGLCSEWRSGIYALDELCPTSLLKAQSVFACECDQTSTPPGVCAAQCGGNFGDIGNDCIHGWMGNEPIGCKLCLDNVSGCKSQVTACATDDGSGTALASSTSSGPNCTCNPALPSCTGSATCETPGDYTHSHVTGVPPDYVCGTATYCAPCCDQADACKTKGTCALTKVGAAPCESSYECCSGVCSLTTGCVSGCGVLVLSTSLGAGP